MNIATTRKIHASQVEQECPHRAHLYETREWVPEQRIPFLRGTAAHGAREYALRSYIASKTLPTLGELEERAVCAVEERVEEDEARGVTTQPEWVTAALDEALPIVRADFALAIPEIAPHVLATEEELEVPIDGTSFVLTGRLDARGRNPVTGEGAILDLKTGAGRSPQETADLSNQLSNYAILHRHHFGTIPTFALDHVWTMSKGPKKETAARDGLQVCEVDGGADAHGQPTKLIGVRRRVVTSRSTDDLAAALRVLRLRIDAEEAGWFPPAYGGWGSPCVRCPHWAHADPSQRCIWRPATRAVPLQHRED